MLLLLLPLEWDNLCSYALVLCMFDIRESRCCSDLLGIVSLDVLLLCMYGKLVAVFAVLPAVLPYWWRLDYTLPAYCALYVHTLRRHRNEFLPILGG